MKNHFKSALDQIQADEALISKTEEYLRMTLAHEQNSIRKNQHKWRVIEMKKFAIAAAVTILVLGGGAKAYATPLSYVSLDINPSVELGVNALGQVVTAEAYNDDGKTVLNGIKATGIGMDVAKAVRTVIDSAADKGFIANDGSTVISVTAETDNDSKATNLEAEAEDGVKAALTENGKSADVRNDKVALARRDEARKLGITPGKLNLIQKLQAVDPTATVEQFKDAKVKDIMKAIQAKTVKGNEVTDDTTTDKTTDATKDTGAVNKENGTLNRNEQGTVNSTNKGAADSQKDALNSKAGNEMKDAAGNKAAGNKAAGKE